MRSPRLSLLRPAFALGLVACQKAPPELSADTPLLPAPPAASPVASSPAGLPAPDPVEACERARSWLIERSQSPAGSADRDEQDEVVRRAKGAAALPGAVPGESCAASVVREMAHAPSCGSAAELIASTLALEAALPRAVIEDSLGSSTPCAAAVVSSLSAMPDAPPWAVDAVEAWRRRQRDPMWRAAALVTLGSLAHKARERGDGATAERVDRVLLGELRAAGGSRAERLQRIEAAGNAGCESCEAELVRALGASDHEVRRTAAGALRFMKSERATHAMCWALERDRNDPVREQAGWALSWEQAFPADRVGCLVRAAARDRSAGVRLTATRSLAALGPDVPDARSALLALTAPEYGDERTRELAMQVVLSRPPEPVREGGL